MSGVKVDHGEIMVEDAADTCDAGGMNEVSGGCQAQEGVREDKGTSMSNVAEVYPGR